MKSVVENITGVIERLLRGAQECLEPDATLGTEVENHWFKRLPVFTFESLCLHTCAFKLYRAFNSYCFNVRHHFPCFKLDICLTNRALKRSWRLFQN